jgi:glucose-6-phosphate-specific signal transduction histidine kinase
MDDLVAVTREALTNVARHARATQAVLTLTADSTSLILEVIDDGDGISNTDRRSGLDNLPRRAETTAALSSRSINTTRLAARRNASAMEHPLAVIEATSVRRLPLVVS